MKGTGNAGNGAGGLSALIGQAMAGYRLDQMIGVGPLSASFLGTRSQQVAGASSGDGPERALVKLIPVLWQLDATGIASLTSQFEREMARLQTLRNPYIVSPFSWGYDATRRLLYILAPYYPSTLAQKLARESALDLSEVSRYLIPLAGALDAAHAQGFLHRDIKPGNILLDASGVALLGDFAVAPVHDLLRASMRLVGQQGDSFDYVAPEVVTGAAIGGASDNYSLAAVLYHMVTGKPPFAGGSAVLVAMRQVSEAPLPPDRLRPGLPAPASAVILNGLAKQPEYRFGQASQLAQAFSAALTGLWVTQGPGA